MEAKYDFKFVVHAITPDLKPSRQMIPASDPANCKFST